LPYQLWKIDRIRVVKNSLKNLIYVYSWELTILYILEEGYTIQYFMPFAEEGSAKIRR
jgi:hypothetical protein